MVENLFQARLLLKAYMLVIYKLTGNCKVDDFLDLNVYENVSYEELQAIEKEVISENNLSEHIIEYPIRIPGSLDKEILRRDIFKNHPQQLRREGII